MTQNDNSFEICEAAIPVYAWSGQEADPLTYLENDLRHLMRKLAEARFDLNNIHKKNEDIQRKFLTEALDVLDAFDRVFRNIHEKEDLVTKQTNIWINNFRTVRRLLEKILTEYGVAPIFSLNGEFDPAWHRVVETVNDPSRPDGFIIEQIRSGYLWNGEILRKTEVVIVCNDDAALQRCI